VRSPDSRAAAMGHLGFNFVTKQSQIFLDNPGVLHYGKRASEAIEIAH
jgi:hypothetical protein